MKKYTEIIKKIFEHVKNNIYTYVILGALSYLVYQVGKMFSDKGLDKKTGEPYYKHFEEPEEKEV